VLRNTHDASRLAGLLIMSTQEGKLIQRKRQLPGLQPEQTVSSTETAPAPGTGTLASPGTLISSFCILFAFSLPAC
jgi:hypothetical protein